VDFHSARAEDGLIHHVFSVCHSDNEDVVQLVYTVHLRQELVDHCFINTSAGVTRRASGLADSVDLIENDNMKARVFTVSGLVILSVLEKLTDLPFRFSNEFVKDLWSIDNLRLYTFQSSSDFTGNERLTSAGRSMEQESLDMVDAIGFDVFRGIPPGVKSTSENGLKLLVQSSNSKFVEVKVFLEELFRTVRSSRYFEDFSRLGRYLAGDLNSFSNHAERLVRNLPFNVSDSALNYQISVVEVHESNLTIVEELPLVE